MKKIILFALLAVSMQLTAAERTQGEMKDIAAQKLWAAAGVKGQRGGVNAQNVRCIYEDDALAVFEPQEAGAFVIVSKSDLASPVIGYSQTDFVLQNAAPALRWFLNAARQTILKAEAEGTTLKTAAHYASYQPVEPFITTLWHQNAPYNLKVLNQYPAGCMAIALAQCINYCRYPSNVNFKGYAWYKSKSSSKYTIDSIDIKSTYFYPFLDTYGRASKGQQNAVATLVRDCGYATYMDYAEEGSGTLMFYSGDALVNDFKYPEECIKYLDCDYSTPEEYYEIIYSELQMKCPIMFGAQDANGSGGHAFVLCGIDNEGLVYVNWGWGGAADGFYDISLLNPDDMEFSNGQHMVYGIRSTPLENDHIITRIFSYSGEAYTFRLGTEKDDNGKEHQTLYADLPYGFINFNASTFKGVFGVFAEDLTDGTSWIISEELQDPIELPSISGYYGNSKDYEEFYFYYYIDGEEGLKPGHTYRMSFGCRDDREGVWHSILSIYGGELAYDIHYTGDLATTTIDEELKPVPVLDAINNVTADRSAESSNMTVVYDAMGRIVYSAPTAHFNLWDVPARGILLVKQGKQVRKVVR